MNTPCISVVLVVCNVDRFLDEAIKSILAQTFTDFEFIIVDFGSTDRSQEIVAGHAAMDNRINFVTIPHCGLSEARNAGCSLAKGRYIAIMDADDVAVADRLMQQLAFLEQHTDVGVLGGACEWIDSTGRALMTQHRPTTDREIRSAFLDCIVEMSQPTVLIRTEAFVSAGGYRGAFAPAEDYDLWLRIAERFQLANLNAVVLKYRVHPHQVSLRKRQQQTLCILAAHASALSRQEGGADPFGTVEEITPLLLTGMGITEGAQQNALAKECMFWTRMMSRAGENLAALDAGIEMLRSFEWNHAERWVIADLRLEVARLMWREKRVWPSLLAAGQAIMMRPIMIGRPLKRVLQRFGLVQRATNLVSARTK